MQYSVFFFLRPFHLVMAYKTVYPNRMFRIFNLDANLFRNYLSYGFDYDTFACVLQAPLLRFFSHFPLHKINGIDSLSPVILQPFYKTISQFFQNMLLRAVRGPGA